MVDREPRNHPGPGEHLRLRYTDVTPGRLFHRFHMEEFHATAFNGTPNGRARFSPIRDANGDIIPTLYGAQTLHCAALETILRDLAYVPQPKHIDMSKLRDIVHSIVRVDESLRLVDLTSVSLTALNLTRRDLIDTDGSWYPYTRKWAEIIHAYAPDAQGLSWVSRQDDTAQVVVLFGDRVKDSTLTQQGKSLRVLFDEPTYSSVLDLLDILDAEFTVPN
jgi:hypothetical protein